MVYDASRTTKRRDQSFGTYRDLLPKNTMSELTSYIDFDQSLFNIRLAPVNVKPEVIKSPNICAAYDGISFSGSSSFMEDKDKNFRSAWDLTDL